MHVRVNTVLGTSPDNGITYLHEKVLPLLHRQVGYRGGMTSVDRAGAVVGLITLWEDKNALETSEDVVADSRAEAVRMIGGDVTVETFEQVVGEIGHPPPTEGCLVRFVSFQIDPAQVDENIAFFKGEDLPTIKESDGFRAVRHLIDRTTGQGLTTIIVSDEDALRAAEVGFEARREKDEAHGIQLRGDHRSRSRPRRQAVALQMKPVR
jgi:hypothetical protein